MRDEDEERMQGIERLQEGDVNVPETAPPGGGVMIVYLDTTLSSMPWKIRRSWRKGRPI